MQYNGVVDFLCYHRDRPGSSALREKLKEAHWSYMDGYASHMVARGPTLTDDGETATGSLHIVGVAGPAAARDFAFDEPNYQAGVYRDVLLRRWHNQLGRTMWDFDGAARDGRRYLVLGFAVHPDVDLAPPSDTSDLIAYGPLLSDAGDNRVGTAALVRSRDPVAARALLTQDRYADIEVHNWQSGGRS